MSRIAFCLAGAFVTTPLLAATVPASPPAQAQAQPTPTAITIKMADGQIDGSLLQPYENVFLLTVTTKEGRVVPQGLWSDHLQSTQVAQKPALMRVQGLTFTNGRTTSTVNVFEPKTLQPISSRQQQIDGKVQARTFSGTHVTVKRTELSGTETESAFDVPTTPYDFNGGMYGLILAALPLRAGLSGSFNAVEEYDDRLSVESFRVLDQERIEAGRLGAVLAWRAEVVRQNEYRMVFWLIRTAPYVVKLEYTKNGAAEIWDWTTI